MYIYTPIELHSHWNPTTLEKMNQQPIYVEPSYLCLQRAKLRANNTSFRRWIASPENVYIGRYPGKYSGIVN